MRKRQRVGAALRRRIAASYHRERIVIQQLRLAFNVQERGWIGNFKKKPGISLICKSYDMICGLVQPAQRCIEEFRGGAAYDRGGHCIRRAARKRRKIEAANCFRSGVCGKKLAKYGWRQLSNQCEFE